MYVYISIAMSVVIMHTIFLFVWIPLGEDGSCSKDNHRHCWDSETAALFWRATQSILQKVVLENLRTVFILIDDSTDILHRR
jgi:hypothetical protein